MSTTKIRSRVFVGILLFLCTLFVSRFYLGAQFPYTHDGENHLARFANYKIAVRELQVPPRVAPVLHNRFGYPVFNYNYPLANILSVPFSFARVSYEVTFAILVVAGLFGGSIGVYRWVSFFTKRRVVRVFSALVWLSTPFIVSTLAYRGSIGEVLAYSLLPWMFWAAHTLTKKQTTRFVVAVGLLGAAFLLSHNITVVFALPLLLVYSLILFKRDVDSWKRASMVGLFAFGSTLWFWLPAVAEMNATVVAQADNQSAFAEHFLTVRQLLSAPMSFGYSLPGGIDSLGLKIGLLSVVLVLVSLIWTVCMAVVTRNDKSSSLWSLSAYVSIAAVCTLFMQLHSSEFIWEQISTLRFMQFPWRWALFFFTLSAPLLALVVSRLNKKMFFLFVMVWLYWMFRVAQIQPVDTFTKTNVDYEHFTMTSSTQNENMAKDFTYTAIGSWRPEAAVLEPPANATILTQVWTGREHIYTVVTTDHITVVEPTMYFPGWETRVNGKRILYKDSDQVKGRIAFDVPPGEYLVETQFTQNTPARLLGNGAFFLTLLVALYFGMHKKKYL